MHPHQRNLRRPRLHILLIALVGCSSEQPSLPASPQSVTGPAVAAAPPEIAAALQDDVTDREAEDFGHRAEEVFSRDDTGGLSEIFDFDALSARASKGFELTEKGRNWARLMVSGTVTDPVGIFKWTQRQAAKGGSVTLLRVHDVDGQKRVLLRVRLPQGGLNYFDIVLQKSSVRGVQGIDLYDFRRGELLSLSIRRESLPVLLREDPAILSSYTAIERQYSEQIEEIRKLDRSLDREPSDRMAAFHALPKETQADKSILLAWIDAADDAKDEIEHERGLAAFRTHYPDDVCVDLVSVDHSFAREEYEKTLDAVDHIARGVGGDPFLAVIAGNCLVELGQTDEAKRRVREAINEEPTLDDLHWGLLRILLEQKDFAGTLQQLKEIDRRFEPDWSRFAMAEVFGEFIKSPQYEAWQRYLEEKP